MNAPARIDCHVHVIGNGHSGSGCELTLRGHYRVFARVLLQQFGLPQSALNSNLDQLFSEKLSRMVATSSLDRVIILAHEKTRDTNGRPILNFGSMYVPNEYVLALARQDSRLLPGVSIHPARPDALDELEKCIAEGAVIMKCLPNCQNINVNDPRFVPFWERMAKAKLPLLAHTGGEVSLPVYEPRYADPSILRLPLDCGVTVIAAHCGTSGLFFDPNYVDEFARLLEQYPTLYGDNSGMMTPIRCRHLHTLLKSPFAQRIVHGSDLPIPISAHWAWLWGLISRNQARECNKVENLLERDVKLKQALGFPDSSFTILSSLLRINGG